MTPKDEKVSEGNRLIAEFDGWYQKERHPPGIFSKENPYYRNNGKEAASVHGFKYHSSWDWLMPVVEKIANYQFTGSEMEADYSYPRTFGMKDSNGNMMFRFNRGPLFSARTLIEATWLAVVEFIQWYNLNTKSKGRKDT